VSDILVDQSLCNGCGICVDVCPYGIFSINEGCAVPDMDASSNCSMCGHCFAFCPRSAVNPGYQNDVSANTASFDVNRDDISKLVQSRRSIRNYAEQTVSKDTFREIFDIIRYAPSGMNLQTVNWLVILDSEEVQRICGLTVEWARNVCKDQPDHPLATVLSMIISMWGKGVDLISHGSPHLVIAYGDRDYPPGFTDSIIAMTQFDLVAPAFGLGTCWAGIIQIAADSSPEFSKELGLSPDEKSHYVMMAGYPLYEVKRIPQRKAANVAWR